MHYSVSLTFLFLLSWNATWKVCKYLLFKMPPLCYYRRERGSINEPNNRMLVGKMTPLQKKVRRLHDLRLFSRTGRGEGCRKWLYPTSFSTGERMNSGTKNTKGVVYREEGKWKILVVIRLSLKSMLVPCHWVFFGCDQTKASTEWASPATATVKSISDLFKPPIIWIFAGWP